MLEPNVGVISAILACAAEVVLVTALFVRQPAFVRDVLAQRATALLIVAILVIPIGVIAVQIRNLLVSHARAKHFIQAITDSVPVRLAYFDDRQRFQFVNQTLCRRFGRTHAQFIGRTLREITHATPSVAVAERMQKAMLGEPQSFEYLDQFDGNVCFIETHLVPHVSPDGKILGVFGVGSDITRLKTVERSLRDLTDVFDRTTDFVVQTDHDGNVQYLNPAGRRAMGLSLTQSLNGHRYQEFCSPETNTRWVTDILPAVQRDGVWVGETEVRLEANRVIPVENMVIAHKDSSGNIARYSFVMRDISQEVAARRELARQTGTLHTVIEAIPDMVAVWDRNERFRLVNRAFERWRGDREDLVGRTLLEVDGPAEYESRRPWIARALAGETVTFQHEYPSYEAVRHVSITYLPLHLEDGSVDGFIGIVRDITDQREEHLRLTLLSERDALTGLLNRAGFEAYLVRHTTEDHESPLALIYIDLDRFKPINDTHGHAVGDSVLREFAQRLLSLTRHTDAVARIGGDEFAIILRDVVDRAHASHIASKIVEIARLPIQVDDLSLTIGASVGVAVGVPRSGGWKGLVSRADRMVYKAKSAGRDGWAVEGD